MVQVSRYQVIWEKLKSQKSVELTAPREYHARLKKAIEKRKYKDITYKYNLLEGTPSKVAFLRFSSNGSLMKVTLHLKNVLVSSTNEIVYLPDL